MRKGTEELCRIRKRGLQPAPSRHGLKLAPPAKSPMAQKALQRGEEIDRGEIRSYLWTAAVQQKEVSMDAFSRLFAPAVEGISETVGLLRREPMLAWTLSANTQRAWLGMFRESLEQQRDLARQTLLHCESMWREFGSPGGRTE